MTGQRLGQWRARGFGRRAHLVRLLLLALPSFGSIALPAVGQVERPADERRELPALPEPAEEREPILPRLELPDGPDLDGLSAGREVFVRGFRFEGNTVVSDAELRELAAPYTERSLRWADLEALRVEITLLLIGRGYVTSGALIPDQALDDGIVEVRIVEGRLEELALETDGRLRADRLRARLQRATRGPVDVDRIEEQLQILQQEPTIERVDAELRPGSARGRSRLGVQITEAPPHQVRAGYGNDKNSAIGEHRGWLSLRHRNVSGFADTAALAVAFGETYRDVDVRYDFPTGLFDTTVGVHGRYTESGVIESDFEQFEILSRSQSYGLRLRTGLRQTASSELGAVLDAEWRRSETLQDGEPFAFVEGTDRGTSTVAVLRAGLDWTWRTRDRVVAGRSLVSAGLGVLGATSNPGGLADGRFVAWLSQLQLAQRLPFDARLVGRVDLQLASSALLGLEQIGLGGSSTVRGYHENEVVSDNGVIASLEIRVPVYRDTARELRVELAPFVDVGHSWNERSPGPIEPTLVGLGLGGRLQYAGWLQLWAYWGHDAIEVDRGLDPSLQGSGFHLGLELQWP